RACFCTGSYLTSLYSFMTQYTLYYTGRGFTPFIPWYSMRTRLHTIAASYTFIFIVKNWTKFSLVKCTYRTNTYTSKFKAMHTHFSCIHITIFLNYSVCFVGKMIFKKIFICCGKIVFFFACFITGTTPDAFGSIEE